MIRSIRRSLARPLLLAGLALGFAGAAEARDETIRWTHELGGQVATFHLFVGSSPGATDLLDQAIGVPVPDGNGVYSYTLTVDSEDTIYVRMTAVDDRDLHSTPSNEVSRVAELGVPGQPVVATP